MLSVVENETISSIIEIRQRVIAFCAPAQDALPALSTIVSYRLYWAEVRLYWAEVRVVLLGVLNVRMGVLTFGRLRGILIERLFHSRLIWEKGIMPRSCFILVDTVNSAALRLTYAIMIWPVSCGCTCPRRHVVEYTCLFSLKGEPHARFSSCCSLEANRRPARRH